MLLLDFEKALMDHVIFLFGVFLYSPVSIDSSMPPDWVRTNFFQLRLELCQRVVIEALEDILAGEAGIAFQDDLTDSCQG